jgi:hypothetical protein
MLLLLEGECEQDAKNQSCYFLEGNKEENNMKEKNQSYPGFNRKDVIGRCGL